MRTPSPPALADALIAKITGNAEDLAIFEQERRQALEHERKQREARRVADPVQAMKESGRQPNTAAGIMAPITSVSVNEITTRPLITAPADTGLRALSVILSENNIRRVVVVARGVPVGVVADTDLFEVVQEFGWDPEE